MLNGQPLFDKLGWSMQAAAPELLDGRGQPRRSLAHNGKVALTQSVAVTQ